MSGFSDVFDNVEQPMARDGGRFSIDLPLKTVTPIMGGSTRPRELDDLEPIRAPAIRGQLRTMWRATRPDVARLPDGAVDADALYTRECAVWGGVDGDTPVRSAVRVRVSEIADAEQDAGDVGWRDRWFYALWPAASQKGGAVPPAPRWRPGLRFRLRIDGPDGLLQEIRDAVRAWLLFGGYGGRTRRGLGALQIDDAPLRAEWLPAEATAEAVRQLFPDLSLGRGQHPLSDMPSLRGAALALGGKTRSGEKAALVALDWLKSFRQGEPNNGPLGRHDPDFARVRGEHHRPSISNWPEADKMRHLQRGRWTHRPQHADDPAWPRAGFGLPIQAQWQRNNRDRGGERYREPEDFQLQWVADGQEHDRLGSPLLIGSMPLRDGSFAPFALWLQRGFPRHGKVVPMVGGRPLREGAADFDKLLGRGDAARYRPLDAAQSEPAGYRLRSAFMDWLAAQRTVAEVIR